MKCWTLPNCDCCGRFVNPSKEGTSWKFVPDSDVSSEELAYRCVRCTEKHGPPSPYQTVVLELCQGIVKNPAKQ